MYKIIKQTYVGKFRDQRENNLRDNPKRREFICWDIVREDGTLFKGGLIFGGTISWTSDKPMFKTKKEAVEWYEDWLLRK